VSVLSSSEAAGLQSGLVALRRRLHSYPEVGLELPQTQSTVLQALEGLPLEITLGTRCSSITAVLRGSSAGPAVLLRADMDALAMSELTGLPYASRHDGAMHACGHDLHTAMLVGAATLLAGRRHELGGDIVLMFQPGEEGHDGAAEMIRDGVLDAAGARAVAAYAIHVMSSRVPHGVFASRRGTVLGGGDVLAVTIRGRGGHGSAPHLARDPIPAACAIVGALQTLATNEVDPQDRSVLTIGSIHSGTASNIIPDRAVLEGSLRWFSEETRDSMRAGFARVCHGVAQAHGVEADPVVSEYAGATVNDDAEADFAAALAAQLFGGDRYLSLPRPLSASEDFSRVLESVPGAFILLGAAPAGTDHSTTADNHSPLATFDDSVLYDGARLYAELAVARLRRESGTPAVAAHAVGTV
jgi:amidohydrolase